MKSALQTKLLRHFASKKNKNGGFTLIELLVVIIIIGILAAIALPSFLNQASKARGAEAKSNVGAMNRAQQSYFLERQTFTNTVDQLGLSMDNSTDNFTYSAAANGTLAPTATAATAGVTNTATSRQADIRGYSGGAFYQTGSTVTILCEANAAGTASPTAPTAPTAAAGTTAATEASCGTGTTEVN